MLGLFTAIKEIVPFSKVRDPQTEGIANRLHYRVTVALLMGCSLLVTCLEWIGNGKRISCVLEGAEDSWTIASNVINTYCYVLTTFTLPSHWNSKVGHNSVAMGVGGFDSRDQDVTHKAYYQWVPFVLFLQGLMFYLPHWIFKLWDGGKVRNIISGLNNLIINKDERTDKEKVLAEYFVDSIHTHNLWAMKLLFVEFLNLINVIANIYFVDAFLGGEFGTYGFKVLEFMEADPETRIDPMAMIFPRVTKCSFFKFGPSGTLQTHDAICVLPINIVNEKIYVFMWFWLIILSFVTAFSLVYHIFLVILPGCAKGILKSRTMNQRDVPLDDIGRFCEMGDWRLLMVLGRNMEPIVFGEFLRELFVKLKDRNADSETKALII